MSGCDICKRDLQFIARAGHTWDGFGSAFFAGVFAFPFALRAGSFRMEDAAAFAFAFPFAIALCARLVMRWRNGAGALEGGRNSYYHATDTYDYHFYRNILGYTHQPRTSEPMR